MWLLIEQKCGLKDSIFLWIFSGVDSCIYILNSCVPLLFINSKDWALREPNSIKEVGWRESSLSHESMRWVAGFYSPNGKWSVRVCLFVCFLMKTAYQPSVAFYQSVGSQRDKAAYWQLPLGSSCMIGLRSPLPFLFQPPLTFLVLCHTSLIFNRIIQVLSVWG